MVEANVLSVDKLVILPEIVLEGGLLREQMLYAITAASQATSQESAGKVRAGEASLVEEHAIITDSALTVCAVELGVTELLTAEQMYPSSAEVVEKRVT